MSIRRREARDLLDHPRAVAGDAVDRRVGEPREAQIRRLELVRLRWPIPRRWRRPHRGGATPRRAWRGCAPARRRASPDKARRGLRFRPRDRNASPPEYALDTLAHVLKRVARPLLRRLLRLRRLLLRRRGRRTLRRRAGGAGILFGGAAGHQRYQKLNGLMPRPSRHRRRLWRPQSHRASPKDSPRSRSPASAQRRNSSARHP